MHAASVQLLICKGTATTNLTENMCSLLFYGIRVHLHVHVGNNNLYGEYYMYMYIGT